MESYRCQSCGAEILINDTTGSGFSKCIYCGSNVTLFKKEYSKLNIKKMVPFRTSEEEAINYLTNVLNYTRRNEILDVKRIFIPVRFCSYDFSYLCSYRYVVSSDEDGTTYDNNDSLIDGSVKEEMILETSIMNNLLGFHDLRGVPREDFDPIKLGRISCEFSEKVREKDIKKTIEEHVTRFCKPKLPHHKEIVNIYNVNQVIDNVNIENFTTLIPVYLVKTVKGANYAVSGVINSSIVEDRDKSNNNYMTLGTVLVMTGMFSFILMPVLVPLGIVFIIMGQKGKSDNNKDVHSYSQVDNYRYYIYDEPFRDKEFQFHEF